MDKELKEKWIAALRSGAYVQATGRLRSYDGQRYCCLGVLCLVLGRSLPTDLNEFPQHYEAIKPVLGDEAIRDLWKRNDGVDGYEHHSFSEVADFVEKYL